MAARRRRPRRGLWAFVTILLVLASCFVYLSGVLMHSPLTLDHPHREAAIMHVYAEHGGQDLLHAGHAPVHGGHTSMHGDHAPTHAGHAPDMQSPANQPTALGSRPHDAMRLKVPIWWFAPFLDSSSFGTEATQLVLPLVQKGISLKENTRISLLQMSCTDSVAGVMAPASHTALLELLHGPPLARPAVVVCHNMPLFMGQPRPRWASCAPCPPHGAAYTIARAMAETSRIPVEFVTAVASLDEVWVPSSFSQQVLVASGVNPLKIRVIPLAINTSRYDQGAHTPLDLEDPNALPGAKVLLAGRDSRAMGTKLFVFLSVGKWEARKGWDVLLGAYLKEFTAHDPVVLYIVTKPFSGDRSIEEDVVRLAPAGCTRASLPRLIVTSSHLPYGVYERLMASADALVMATRGEGWGLPIVEAMSMGLPVIATNWSGITAYLDDSVGYPLRCQEVDVPDTVTESWFKGSRWAQPDAEHLRQLMRHVTLRPHEANAKGRAARLRMLQRYSHDAISNLLYDEFRRIEGLLGIS